MLFCYKRDVIEIAVVVYVRVNVTFNNSSVISRWSLVNKQLFGKYFQVYLVNIRSLLVSGEGDAVTMPVCIYFLEKSRKTRYTAGVM